MTTSDHFWMEGDGGAGGVRETETMTYIALNGVLDYYTDTTDTTAPYGHYSLTVSHPS